MRHVFLQVVHQLEFLKCHDCVPLVDDHPCKHIDEYLLTVKQEQLEDLCCSIKIVSVDEKSN